MTKHYSGIGFYLSKSGRERIDYIYEHYADYESISKSYRNTLESLIAGARIYERRKRDDLGVRIKSGNGLNDVTSAMAIENHEISRGIDKGSLPAGMIRDKGEEARLNLGIYEMQVMKREYDIFNAAIMNLKGNEMSVFLAYIRREKSIKDISEEEGIEKDSAVKRIYRIKMKLVRWLADDFREYEFNRIKAG